MTDTDLILIYKRLEDIDRQLKELRSQICPRLSTAKENKQEKDK